jgi:hypothetical protein
LAVDICAGGGGWRGEWDVGVYECGGGAVLVCEARELFDKVGFGWAVQIGSLVMLGTLGSSLVLLKPHARNVKKGKLFDVAFLRDVPYTLFILGELMR